MSVVGRPSTGSPPSAFTSNNPFGNDCNPNSSGRFWRAASAVVLDADCGKDAGCRVGEYTLIKQLGDGTYGTVFLATHNRTHESFAVKRILMDRRSMATIERQVRREATLMQGLHHPHVVRLIQVLQTQDAFYFVMELAEGGELFDMVINSKKFSECTARKYFQQLISALHYCHSKDVIHRDLKAENLLLSRTGQLKVCDFGFSLHFKSSEIEDGDEGGEMLGEPECGTADYMAPEYARNSGFGGGLSNNDVGVLDPHMHDLWAAGVILYFMLVGSLPFHGRSEEETLYKISTTSVNLDGIESEGARLLLARMLAMDPTDRPSIVEILNDAWFAVGIEPSMFPEMKLARHNSILMGGTTASSAANGGLGTRNPSRLFNSFTPIPSGEQLDTLDAESTIIADAFNSMDVDDDGILTRDEIRDAVLELNSHTEVPKGDVAKIVAAFIPPGSDGIDLGQFTQAWVERDVGSTVLKEFPYFRLRNLSTLVHAPVEASLVHAVRAVFDHLDADHDGKFTANDVEALIARHPTPIASNGAQPSSCDAIASDHDGLSSGRGSRFDVMSCSSSPTTTAYPSSCVVSNNAYPAYLVNSASNSTPGSPAGSAGSGGFVDATGVKELISFLDTKGSGTILFDEFLTGTARSNVFLDHRVGNRLKHIIPAMSDLRSRLLITGTRFTVSGTIDTIKTHIMNHSPERLRYESMNATSAGVELLFDYMRPDVGEASASTSTSAFGVAATAHIGDTGQTTGPRYPMSASSHSVGASTLSMPPTPPNGNTTVPPVPSYTSTTRVSYGMGASPRSPEPATGPLLGYHAVTPTGYGHTASGFAAHTNSFPQQCRLGVDYGSHRHWSSSSSPITVPAKLGEGVGCRISVQLTQLCQGFVGVLVTRIAGNTMYYHDAIAMTLSSVEEDREQAIHETQPVGDSELM